MDLRKLAVFSLVVGLGAFAQGCGDACVGLCEDEVDAGCRVESNCETACENQAADADTTGCRSQYDDLIDCAAGEDACTGVSQAGGACATESATFVACFIQFCTDPANADSPACS